MTAPERARDVPVGASLPHESAHLHVSGAAPYLDDLPELKGTLYGAFATSPSAHGRIRGLDLSAARELGGVVAVLTAADIPARNNAGPSVIDDPLLAKDTVVFHGQALALIIAESYETARRAARLVKADIESLPALLTVDEAAAVESWVLPPVSVSRGDADAALSSAPHRLKGTARVGGQ